MNSSLFIGSLLFSSYGHKVSFSSHIVSTFAVQAAIMLLIPFAGNVGGTEAYWYCYCLLFVYGLFSGVCQSACYSYNAKLPSSYIAVFLTSHGLAGIASNLLRLAGLSIWPTQQVIATSTGEAISTVDDSNAFKSCLFM